MPALPGGLPGPPGMEKGKEDQEDHVFVLWGAV